MANEWWQVPGRNCTENRPEIAACSTRKSRSAVVSVIGLYTVSTKESGIMPFAEFDPFMFVQPVRGRSATI